MSPSDPRGLDWLGTASLGMVVAAWAVLVLYYEYQVAWLGAHVIAADAFFLLGLAGIVVTRSVERRGAAHVASVALRFAFSLVVLAGALCVAEVGVRFTFRGLVEPTPAVSLNSLGFRDREIGPKDPHRYRIAVIGDSFTFGNGVEEPDRFSNLIQGYLGSRYEVLNFGHPGNNLPEHLDELDLVLKMQPDFVLLQLYENDFETPDMMQHRPRDYTLMPDGLDQRMMRSSVLYRLLIDHWNQLQEAAGLAEGYTNYMARHLRDPAAPDAHDTAVLLMTFIERARAAGMPNGGIFFPALYGLGSHGANYPFDYLNDRVQKIYTLEQTPYLDLLPAFLTASDPPSLWVSRFDPHPNAKANHLAAIAILNKFGPIWHH
jgi:hypothetical protein